MGDDPPDMDDLARKFPHMFICDWGRHIATLDDQAPCRRGAQRRIALHQPGDEAIDRIVQLCQPHIDRVLRETNPHHVE